MTRQAYLPSYQDLGIELDEDSTDFTAEEAESAVSTSSQVDFMGKAKEALAAKGAKARFQLRRRAGILYCRMSVEETSWVFRTDWLGTST